jgi:TPR repeat protein
MKRLMMMLAVLTLMLPFAGRAEDSLARADLAASDGEWVEALYWYEVSGEAGTLRAQETAAFMYLNGERLFPGVERNVPLAKAWYYRAEGQGSAMASRMLAEIERSPVDGPAPAVAAAESAPVR